jgi:hypothetical protein
MDLLIIAIAMIALAAFAVAANELGVDSRDFSDDARRSSNRVGIA